MSAGVSSDQRMKGQGNQGMFGPSFGQQSSSSYNYFPGNGDFNTWGSQQVNAGQHQQASNNKSHQQQHAQSRKNGQGYDDYYSNRDNAYGNDGVKRVEQGIGGLALDGGSSRNESSQGGGRSNLATNKPDPPKESAPKQMTWASIASQPAKPQIRANSSSSILKKKGPGMPPPPMVPGKHNLDIGTWDSPKNGPALVPPPPLPIVIQPPINTDEVSPLSNDHPLNNPQLHKQKQQQQQQQQQHQQNHHHNSLNRNAPTPPLSGGPSRIDSGPMGPGGPGDFRTAMQNRGADHRDGGGYNNRSGGPPSRPAWSGNQNIRDNRGGQQQQQQQLQQHDSRGGIMPSFHRSTNMSSGGPGGNRGSPPPMTNYRDSAPITRSTQNPPVDRMTQPIPVAEPPQLSQQLAVSPPTAKPHSEFGGSSTSIEHPVVEELHDKNQYNPQDFDFDTCKDARFFVIKSYSEDDIHRSIKYEIWCSTDHGNRRLDQAFHEREKANGVIYLLFSVNGSGHFCGVAQMLTAVDYNTVSSVWSQSKWKGSFKVKWIYVKDVPNTQVRHIRLENNENKSVTNSRDTQEVPNAQGIAVLRIISTFKHMTSIFDDFVHYEKRQEEERDTKRVEPPAYGVNGGKYGGSYERGGGGGYGGGYDRNKGGYGGEYGQQQGGYNNRGGGGGGGYGSGNGGSYDNRRGGDDYNYRGGSGGGYDRSNRDSDSGGDRGYNRDRDGGASNSNFHRNQQPRKDYRERRDDGGNNRGFMSRDRDNNDNRDGGDRGGDRGGYNSRGYGRGGDFQRSGDSYNDKY